MLQSAPYDARRSSITQPPDGIASGQRVPSSSGDSSGSSRGEQHPGVDNVTAADADHKPRRQQRRMPVCSDSAGADDEALICYSRTASEASAEAAQAASACFVTTSTPLPEPPLNPFAAARGSAWSGTLPIEEVADIGASLEPPAVPRLLPTLMVWLPS